jgi:broad specificity phosphatase PhoE
MITGLREIADKCAGQTAIIVSHEIPLAVVRCAAYGGDLCRMWDFVPQNCQPSLIRWPLQREVEIPGEIPQRLAA